MHTPALRYLLAFGLFSCALTAKSTGGTQIPLEDFFRPPVLHNASLSPDGKKLAALTAQENETGHLLFMDTDSKKIVTVMRSEKRHEIDSFDWLSERYVSYRVIHDNIYGGETTIMDLTKLNRPDRNLVTIPGTQIIGAPQGRAGRVLLWFRGIGEDWEGSGVKEFDLTRINLSSSVRSYPEPREGVFVHYDSDVTGELALGYAYQDTHYRAFLFDFTSDSWKTLPFDPDYTGLMTVEQDRQHIWLTEQNPKGGYFLQRMDLRTEKHEQPVVTDQRFNPQHGRIHYSLKGGTLAGISYDQQRRRNVWFLPRFVEIQAAVNELLPDTDNLLVNFDREETRFLFLAYSDQNPGAYYLLEPDKGTLTPIGPTRPWLKGRALRPSSPMSFITRDGLKLDGYLTLPEGADTKHKAPLIMLCHGGPWTRDTWGFDEEVQFFASRGYAVFQPNYRGSTGYSAEISLEYKYDFRRMHDDVTDATRELQKLDPIDAGRVAIVGASFGGYLAVAGMAFEPGLYRCAVTNCGVFDWRAILRDARWEGWAGEYESLSDRLGKPGRDKEALEKMSPLFSAKAIVGPVFIAYSKTDGVVDESQSLHLISELRRNKTPHETFFRDDEGHGFTSFKTRVEYYQAVEKFLARYLVATSEKR